MCINYAVADLWVVGYPPPPPPRFFFACQYTNSYGLAFSKWHLSSQLIDGKTHRLQCSDRPGQRKCMSICLHVYVLWFLPIGSDNVVTKIITWCSLSHSYGCAQTPHNAPTNFWRCFYGFQTRLPAHMALSRWRWRDRSLIIVPGRDKRISVNCNRSLVISSSPGLLVRIWPIWFPMWFDLDVNSCLSGIIDKLSVAYNETSFEGICPELSSSPPWSLY